MSWYVTGDIHGEFSRAKSFEGLENVIVLGDFGANYFGADDWKDKKFKKKFNSLGTQFYIVRGNHEARPQNIYTIKKVWDESVQNYVYVEPEYPNIHYFMDYGIYFCGGYRCAVIGGAYSVDKDYRLQNGLKWFSDEQLTEDEMKDCMHTISGGYYDFIFSHTCPLRFEPTDLFLDFIDQSTVDNTMEKFLDEIYTHTSYNAWCWGHFHSDRLEAPNCEMLFRDIESLDKIYDRWQAYAQGESLDWWLIKSPNFYQFV